MSRHRFTDAAGYTIHCHECIHAGGWEDGRGRCELTGRIVCKADSPNNQCSHVGFECRYETGCEPGDANESPTAVPIVLCKDCARFGRDQSDHEFRGEWWCSLWRTDLVKLDTFCAWGERKADRE